MLNESLRGQLDELRAAYDSNTAPGGINLWWGGSTLPDGVKDTPALDQTTFQSFYGYLEASSARPGQVLPWTSINAAVRSREMDGVIPLVLACFEVGALKPELRNEIVNAAADDRPLGKMPGNPAEVINSARVVMACCPMAEQFNRALPAYRGRVVRFRLEREFWLSNFRTERPRSFQVDPGDGLGERTLTFGEELTCVYPAGGGSRDVTIRFKMDGEWLSARARFAQVDDAAPPPSSETWSLLRGLTPVGQAWLHPATAPNESRSLIILVEGFPGGYSRGYLYEMFNQHGLVDTWRSRGYDVALLGFTNGMGRIETNAVAVQSAINKAITLTDPSNPHADVSYHDIVVGAVSMGGLVARYALTELEALSQPHRTRVFFTVDTPHQGAYTSLAIQWFVHYFADSMPEMTAFKALLDCPANQQFVKYWLHDGEVAESPIRAQFVDRLKSLGNYPSKPVLLALASGAGDGECTMERGQEILTWRGSEFVGAQLNALGEPGVSSQVASGAGYRMPSPYCATFHFTADEVFEGVPGGYNYYPYAAFGAAQGLACGEVSLKSPTSTSIPTVSALDLDQSPLKPIPPYAESTSPFDDYTYAEQNMPHVNMTPAMGQWLLDKIGYPSKIKGSA